MRKLTPQELETIAAREYPAYRHIIALAVPRLLAACERNGVGIVFLTKAAEENNDRQVEIFG